MNLQEIPAVKRLVLDKIQEDENLLKAIGINDASFKDFPTPSFGNLLNANIFRYRYPRTLENETKVILSMEVSMRRNQNKTQTKDGYITLFIYTHADLEDTNYGIIRTDYILNKLDVLLNNSTVKNILGDLQFHRADPLPPVKDWTAFSLSYSFSSFNDNKYISDVDYE